MKKRLISFLKLAVTALALAWMIQSGLLSFQSIILALKNPAILFISAITLLICQCLGVYRWMQFVRHVVPGANLSQCMRYHAIGLFFSSVLPGVVSGDIIKAVYVAKDLGQSRVSIFSTVIVDRIFGLAGVILLAGVGALLSLALGSELSSSWHGLMSSVLFLNVGLFLGIFMLYKSSVLNLLLSFLASRNLALCHHLAKLLTSIRQICPPKLWVFNQILVSVFIHALVTMSCYLFHLSMLSPEGGTVLDWHTFFKFLSVTPVGLLVAAIPILPGGLGTGHASFESFYRMIGLQSGAEVFTLLFITQFLFGLMGGAYYFWLLARGMLKAPPHELLHSETLPK